MQRVDASTLRVLKDFNVSSDGYTLIVPTNRATNFSDPDLDIEPIFSLYGIDPVFISAENATLVRPPLSAANAGARVCCCRRAACDTNGPSRLTAMGGSHPNDSGGRP